MAQQMIDEGTPEDLIQAASRIEGALREDSEGSFATWLRESIGALTLRDDPDVINAILRWKVRIATTNYDNFFEDATHNTRPVVLWSDNFQATRVLRNDATAILHLHGHYDNSRSVVFGARSYEDVCRDNSAQEALKSMLLRDTIVFIGCGAGLKDPNFGGLMKWARTALADSPHTHYHVVLDSELAVLSTTYQGLRVTPVSCGEDYSKLAEFLNDIADEAGLPELSATGISTHPDLPEISKHRQWLKEQTANSRDGYVKLDCTDKGGRRWPLDEAIHDWRSDTQRTVLYLRGSYGAGKSCFCYHYSDYLFAHEPSVHPLFVRLSKCTPTSAKPVGIDVALEGYGTIAFAKFKEIAAAGPTVLFLDGLDETSDEMQQIVNAFRSLEVPTIVTFRDSLFDGEEAALTRFRKWEGGRDSFSYLSICPFTVEKRDKMIEALAGDACEGYKSAVRESELLDALTRTPVVLRLILSLPDAELVNIGSQSDIYGRAFEYVVQDAENELGLSDGELRKFVEDAAWWMFQNKRRKKASIHPTTSSGASPVSPISDLTSLSLLFTLPNTSGEVEFRHRSFYEYLVAQRLAKAVSNGVLADFDVDGIYFEILHFLGDLICHNAVAWDTLVKWFGRSKKRKHLRENCIRLLGQWRNNTAMKLLVDVVRKPKERAEHRRDAIRSICRILCGEDGGVEEGKLAEMGEVTAWAIRTDRRTYNVGPDKIKVSRCGMEAGEEAGLKVWISTVQDLMLEYLEKRGEVPDAVRLNASFALIHLARNKHISRLHDAVVAEMKLLDRAKSKKLKSWHARIALNLWQAIRTVSFSKSLQLKDAAEE